MLPSCNSYVSMHNQKCKQQFVFLCTQLKSPDQDDYESQPEQWSIYVTLNSCHLVLRHLLLMWSNFGWMHLLRFIQTWGTTHVVLWNWYLVGSLQSPQNRSSTPRVQQKVSWLAYIMWSHRFFGQEIFYKYTRLWEQCYCYWTVQPKRYTAGEASSSKRTCHIAGLVMFGIYPGLCSW